MELKQPKLYKGEIYIDDRGIVGFNNDLDLSPIKRFYTITNHVPGFIRAWHGHLNEEKYFVVMKGSAIIAAIPMTIPPLIEGEHPFDVTPHQLDYNTRYIETLHETIPSVYYIPNGYANGFKLLSPDTKLLVLSTSTTAESKDDDYRVAYIPGYIAPDPFEVKVR